LRDLFSVLNEVLRVQGMVDVVDTLGATLEEQFGFRRAKEQALSNGRKKMKGESHSSAIAAALAYSPSGRIKWEVALVRLLAPTPLIRLRLEEPE
jgi:hypothetical protein